MKLDRIDAKLRNVSRRTIFRFSESNDDPHLCLRTSDFGAEFLKEYCQGQWWKVLGESNWQGKESN